MLTRSLLVHSTRFARQFSSATQTSLSDASRQVSWTRLSGDDEGIGLITLNRPSANALGKQVRVPSSPVVLCVDYRPSCSLFFNFCDLVD
jgi:hypothetical protein